MRRSRIAIAPLPRGKGFSVSGRAAALLTLALAFVPTAGHAAADVKIGFRISTLAYTNADVTCQVTVPAGSDGIVALQAAVDTKCIKGFTLQVFGNGHFVDCIDDAANGNRCGDPAPSYLRYWAMRLDCSETPYGVDDYHASAGDELAFSYEVSFLYGVPTVASDGTVCS